MTVVVQRDPRPRRRHAAARAAVVVQRLTDPEPWEGVLLFWPPPDKPQRRAKVTRMVDTQPRTFHVPTRFVHLRTDELASSLGPGVRVQPCDQPAFQEA